MTWSQPVARVANVPREYIGCRSARARLARHLEQLEIHLAELGRPAEAHAVKTELRLLAEVGAECCTP